MSTGTCCVFGFELCFGTVTKNFFNASKCRSKNAILDTLLNILHNIWGFLGGPSHCYSKVILSFSVLFQFLIFLFSCLSFIFFEDAPTATYYHFFWSIFFLCCFWGAITRLPTMKKNTLIHFLSGIFKVKILLDLFWDVFFHPFFSAGKN